METFKGFQIVGRRRKQCKKNTRRDLARELSLFRCCAVFEHLEKASELWVPGVLQSAVFHSIMPDMSVSANSPYACLRQTSKFHHQVSFSKYKVAKFCINEFPGQYSWKEYPRIKSANAKNFAFKWGLVVKFARLTQSRIRAIEVTRRRFSSGLLFTFLAAKRVNLNAMTKF